MRIIRILLGGFALLAAGPQPASAQGFLAAYEDLPLAPGLTEMTDAGLVFDSAAGRIVEAHARGQGAAAEVLAFYAKTLPQLGWTRESDTAYRRDAERLRLDTSAEGRALVVHFTISPE